MPDSWSSPIDAYCERLGPGFWAEPLNALSNGAFLIAAALALVLWRRTGGRDMPALVLIVVTAVVGLGSFLFHTVAQRWAALADVIPIAVFINGYFLLAMRRFAGLGLVPALAATLAFAAFAAAVPALWRSLAGFGINGSEGYLPAALALVGTGLAVRARSPGAARGLFLAAGSFAVSLVLRSLDNAACAALPFGTHFAWHILNAGVLFVLLRTAIADGAGAVRDERQ